MKLIEALEILKRPVLEEGGGASVFLACGFTPLHLQTFLAAELRRLRPHSQVEVKTGLFGDLIGSIEWLQPAGIDALAAVLEWEDLDPRLAIRNLGGWRLANLSDIKESASRAAARFREALAKVSRSVTTVVSMPTLALPPLFPTRPSQAGSLELGLHHIVSSLAEALSGEPGIRITSPQFLADRSPAGERFDVKSAVLTGFPYSIRHASAMGEMLAGQIQNPPPKKGLILDLDNTLWNGILGEDGVDGISWNLDAKTHMHGVFQQFVASLADAGVLIGVASKNDAAAVDQAFDRRDLLISRTDIFPFEVHWFRKSESVERILKVWNIAADAVVFVDDSPMEVAEVQAAFPEMECIVYPGSDYQRVWDLLRRLRGAFGKSVLTEDDERRLASIRNSGMWQELAQSGAGVSDDFLKDAKAVINFEWVPQGAGARAFELINKTNQFNLNGKRLSEAEWRRFFSDPASFLLVASYEDKYGSLGKIAAIMGRAEGRKLEVNTWVMSCRAFSRRIEHQCLKQLFAKLQPEEIMFDYEGTPRNTPLQEFFTQMLGYRPAPGVSLTRELFDRNVPTLFHRVEESVHA